MERTVITHFEFYTLLGDPYPSPTLVPVGPPHSPPRAFPRKPLPPSMGPTWPFWATSGFFTQWTPRHAQKGGFFPFLSGVLFPLGRGRGWGRLVPAFSHCPQRPRQSNCPQTSPNRRSGCQASRGACDRRGDEGRGRKAAGKPPLLPITPRSI